MTCLMSSGKTNKLLKLQPYLVNTFGVIVIDSKTSKTNESYSGYMEDIIDKSQVQVALELGNASLCSP